MNAALINQLEWSKNQNAIKNLILVVGGSLVLALLAQIRIPLPFTPVPITGQSLGVLLIGLTFGSKRAIATVLLYLLEGLVGLPVFAGGAAGLAVLTGTTAGYLIGFVVAAGLLGALSDQSGDLGLKGHISMIMLGHFVIFACGLLWLGQIVGWNQVLELGLFPFIPGMVIKSILAGSLMTGLWKIKGH